MKHKQWTMILGRFQNIPLNDNHKKIIDRLLKDGKNILILMRKEEGSEENWKKLQKERFEEFCKIYPEETKNGRMILSAVPDINEIVDWVEGDWRLITLDREGEDLR